MKISFLLFLSMFFLSLPLFAEDPPKPKTVDTTVATDVDLTKNHFEMETRVGGIISTGNTSSISLSGSNSTKYRVKHFENTWQAGAFYNRIHSTTGSATVGTAARYIFGTYRLDYYFLPLTTVFVGGGGYTDQIKGIGTAAQAFTGVKHYFIRNEKIEFGGSVGYNFTFEDRLSPNANQEIHSASQRLLFKYAFNDHVELSQKVDTKENVQNGRDFRLDSDTEIKVALVKHLSFVTGFKLRFDNQPVTGFKKLDTITNLSLAISF